MEVQFDEQVRQYCQSQRSINAVYETYAKSVGIPYTTLYVMTMIDEISDCTQKQICDLTHLPRQTVNSVITNLYNNGYVALKEQKQDRRTKAVCLTDKGRALADDFIAKIHKAEQEAMKALASDERGQLIALTEKYAACLDDVMNGGKD